MAAANDEILDEAQRWSEQGRRVAIATVIETWGSAPRPSGSHLVVAADGAFLGSVSGGCVEADVIAAAQDAIATGRGRLLEFGVADQTAWRAGLSCGGRIKVDVRPLDPVLLRALNSERAARRACAVVTELRADAQRLVRADDPMIGTVADRLRRRESGVEETGSGPAFVNVYLPPPRIIAIGAVHISQALAPMAAVVGFETIIVDPRTAFAAPERFPAARLIAEWPGDALATLGVDDGAALVLLTHEPRIDDEALAIGLRHNCFYIGALGSRKTHAARLERMRAQQFGAADLARIRAPIGLDIGARSAAEIAVAILAEIIAAQNGSGAARASGQAA